MVQATEQLPEAAMVAPQLIDRNDADEINYPWLGSHWVSKGYSADGPCCVEFFVEPPYFPIRKICHLLVFLMKTFLFYEDEDLSRRAFKAFPPMVVVSRIRVKHLSRGSVKGHAPLRSEFLRGYNHVQSKFLFEKAWKNCWWAKIENTGISLAITTD